MFEDAGEVKFQIGEKQIKETSAELKIEKGTRTIYVTLYYIETQSTV